MNKISKDWTERSNASDRIGKIVRSVNWGDHTTDGINEVKRLTKLTGRAAVISAGPWSGKMGTAGGLLDRMIDNYRSKQIQSGQKPQFTGSATTTRDMARQISTQTNGTYRQKYARVWTTGRGQRYKDPSDFVEFKTDDDYDDAWEWIQSRGKKVYYYDNFKHLNTAIKIGKFIVEPASYTLGVFSGSPETIHAISVRTARVINQAVRTQVDITDQQAVALKDIAATKNKNAMDGIKLIVNVLQGEQDIKNIINISSKLDTRDKEKLDKIIAGAQDFKEPDQGIVGGSSKI